MVQSNFPEPALPWLKLLKNSPLHEEAMEKISRDWVTLGLILTVHPRLKAPDQDFHEAPGSRVTRLLARLGNEPALRPREGRDIFSGDFPDWADKEIRAARNAGVAIVTWEDAGYPASLRNLPDPPPFL